MNKKNIIGITGNVGSGKSTVAKIFSELGASIYNSDDRAKEMYYKDSCKEQIISLLGQQAYKEDGTLDRQYVAGLIFNDKALLDKINSIIHPLVKKDFELFVKNNENKLVIHESALFIEANLMDMVSKLILVTAPEELRIERIKKRDNSSVEQIKARIANQISDELKIKYADFIIVNDEKEPLKPKVEKIFELLLNWKTT